jgi:hypothetical protein
MPPGLRRSSTAVTFLPLRQEAQMPHPVNNSPASRSKDWRRRSGFEDSFLRAERAAAHWKLRQVGVGYPPLPPVRRICTAEGGA